MASFVDWLTQQSETIGTGVSAAVSGAVERALAPSTPPPVAEQPATAPKAANPFVSKDNTMIYALIAVAFVAVMIARK